MALVSAPLLYSPFLVNSRWAGVAGEDALWLASPVDQDYEKKSSETKCEQENYITALHVESILVWDILPALVFLAEKAKTNIKQ